MTNPQNHYAALMTHTVILAVEVKNDKMFFAKRHPYRQWHGYAFSQHRVVLNMHRGDWHIWLSLRPRHKTGIYCHGDGMPHRQNRSEWWERISIIPPSSSTRFKAQTLPAHTSSKSPLAIKPRDLFIFVKLPLSFIRNWFLPSFVAAIGACVWNQTFVFRVEYGGR